MPPNDLAQHTYVLVHNEPPITERRYQLYGMSDVFRSITFMQSKKCIGEKVGTILKERQTSQVYLTPAENVSMALEQQSRVLGASRLLDI